MHCQRRPFGGDEDFLLSKIVNYRKGCLCGTKESGNYGRMEHACPYKTTTTYNSTSGVIKSPSYPNRYPDNADSTYIITVPIGKIICLTTDTFDVEDESECNHDWLEIRNGSSEDSPTIGKYCGTNLPSIHSAHNTMWMRWFGIETYIKSCHIFN